MDALTPYLIAASAMLLLSVVASKGAGRFGIPALSIFLVIGMLAGAEGIGGFALANVETAKTLGILALIFILYSGGLGTRQADVRAVRASGLVLSTAGTVVTAALVGMFSTWFLGLSRLSGFLLGATVAATDVAAVFTILRSRNVSLKGRIRPLLELESALNDPMAVFLSVGALQLIVHSEGASAWTLVTDFFLQMTVGTIAGIGAGRATRWIVNHARLEFEGLYPVLSMALVVLTFGLTQTVHGSGFLAVYVSGIVLGNTTHVHKLSLSVFHDGLAWLMQIAMFLTMGLLVLPGELWQVTASGVALAAFLVLAARPISVMLCLAPFRFSWREQLMVSWGGLRGAVPIILATYPLLAGAPGARLIFNLVFFVVFFSVLVQATTIPAVARWLRVDAPLAPDVRYPIQFDPTSSLKNDMVEIPVPAGSRVIGRTLVDLSLPAGALIVLIHRGDDVFVPRGGTAIQAGDRLLVLAEKQALVQIRAVVGSPSGNS